MAPRCDESGHALSDMDRHELESVYTAPDPATICSAPTLETAADIVFTLEIDGWQRTFMPSGRIDSITYIDTNNESYESPKITTEYGASGTNQSLNHTELLVETGVTDGASRSVLGTIDMRSVAGEVGFSYILDGYLSLTVLSAAVQGTSHFDLDYTIKTEPPPIPEPSTAALLATGLCGVAILRRRSSTLRQ